MSNLSLALTIGLDWAASILVGIFFGRFLDARLHTAPILMIVGLLLGMAGGMWGSYRIVQRRLKEDEQS